MLPRVGVLYEPASAATLHDIAQATGRCRPVLLFQQTTARANPELVRVSRLLGEAVVAPDEALVDAAASLELAGVTTFRDRLLDLSDAIAKKLGLPGATGGASAWDKLVQRHRLREHGLSTPDAVAVDSPDDFRRAADRLGQPCVLKPRRAAGSCGIAFVDDPADVVYQLANRRHWSGLLLEARLPDGRHPSGKPWLADYVSVETVSTADRHHHVAVFDKLPQSVVRRALPDGADSVIECGDVFPSRLPDEQRAGVLDYVTQCLDALDVRHRVTHTEIRLTPAGPELIEINGRVGGLLNRLLRLVDGADLVAAALQVATGGEPELPWHQLQGCAIGLTPPFAERTGAVRAVVSLTEARTLSGVVGVDEIATSGRPRATNDFRAINLTLAGATWPELERSFEDAVRDLRRLFAGDRLDLPGCPW